ncbi:MAG TPA: tetratricopeptide repeat protein [Pyrinomonadaceae bacterium]|nr:tetratricopeptide repeat protein [Pyrinomonadaceae bacterium]
MPHPLDAKPARPARPTPRTTPAALAAALAPLLTLLVAVAGASAQSIGIGAHRGEVAGTGGTRALQGHIISPTGRLPETRIRVTIESTNSGTRTSFTDADGKFNFNNLEPGPYQVTIDAGKDYEVVRETVHLDGSRQMANLPVYLRLKPEANPAFAGAPKAALDLFFAAERSARDGDPVKAADQLKQAIALHPQFGPAHNELGELHMKGQRLDEALASFAAAEKALPEDFSVQLNYGVALVEKKSFGDAEKRLRRAVKLSPNSPSARLYLGLALVGLKNLDGAEAELKQAAKLGGDQMGVAHKYLGGIYWGRKDFKRAADELELYLKLTPKAPDAERIRDTVRQLRSN